MDRERLIDVLDGKHHPSSLKPNVLLIDFEWGYSIDFGDCTVYATDGDEDGDLWTVTMTFQQVMAYGYSKGVTARVLLGKGIICRCVKVTRSRRRRWVRKWRRRFAWPNRC
jgi:hypothetical protein